VPVDAPDTADEAAEERATGSTEPGAAQGTDPSESEAASTDRQDRDELRLTPEPATSGTDARAVLVPTAPMLRDPLGIQRALRPLKRQVASGQLDQLDQLDETATADRIAEQPAGRRLWLPVLRAAPPSRRRCKCSLLRRSIMTR
jgi:hypothetical protein